MMNDSIRVMRRPHRAWLPDALTVAVIIVAVALALLLAGCGGSPSSTGSGGAPNAGGSTASPSAVAYSHCMRSHGVPNFPDPSGDGQVPPKADPQQLGVSSSQLRAAQRACQPLYPTNGGAISASLIQCEETGNCPQTMVQQVMNGMRRLAACMRSHGVPGWPDPTVDSEGRPGFNLLHVQGFNPDSSQIDSKLQECEHTMPGGAPVPLIRPGGPG
jgi:hypothetical protein